MLFYEDSLFLSAIRQFRVTLHSNELELFSRQKEVVEAGKKGYSKAGCHHNSFFVEICVCKSTILTKSLRFAFN